jgi:kynurenine formamidase
MQLKSCTFRDFRRKQSPFSWQNGRSLALRSILRVSIQDFKVHQELCNAQELVLENIANLDKIPESGALLYVIPMFIQNGTGVPARVFAKLP